MGEFMEACVASYEKLKNWKCIRNAATPFLQQEEEPPPSKAYYAAVANALGINGLIQIPIAHEAGDSLTLLWVKG